MYNHKSRLFVSKYRFVLFFLISFSLYLAFLLVSVRYIRNLFPIPQISSSKIVGYAHFTGYPFYFDTIFIFSIVFFPLVFFLAVRKTNKNEKNK